MEDFISDCMKDKRLPYDREFCRSCLDILSYRKLALYDRFTLAQITHRFTIVCIITATIIVVAYQLFAFAFGTFDNHATVSTIMLAVIAVVFLIIDIKLFKLLVTQFKSDYKIACREYDEFFNECLRRAGE